MAFFRKVSTHTQNTLDSGWEFTEVPPGGCSHPEELGSLDVTWRSAQVPGTVATALQLHQLLQNGSQKNLDASDWWYRCHFAVVSPRSENKWVLKCDGLASIAEVWLNGHKVLSSDNMFLKHEVEITDYVREKNEIHLRFLALERLLAERRPRPRWRTKLVNHQQLRWFRTTLVGLIPGWTPPLHAVGPWRPLLIEERAIVTVDQVHLLPSVTGDEGIVQAQIKFQPHDGTPPTQVIVTVSGYIGELSLQQREDEFLLYSGTLHIPKVDLWWPHTHGPQHLHAAKVSLVWPERVVDVDCDRIGFRTITGPVPDANDFNIALNGRDIFCRGACWTTLDVHSLIAREESYRRALLTARDAGMNMLRISGTLFYEADEFYQLCDELGILVWQDFMFANMDYPSHDDQFHNSVTNEVQQVLDRLQAHPCVTVLCGNNEVEQQVSMLGLPKEFWRDPLFAETLPELCAQICPDAVYWPSSPSGGVLPFQPSAGNAHYQGVGAFLQPLADARLAEVRFASECLTFANVPEDQTIDLFIDAGELSVMHPKWKIRTSRDNGVGWDFEDIRDHYLQQLFQVDPFRLRYSQMDRYLALSRVTTGEVMAAVFAEWRRKGSTCHGGLVWFFQDFWPGTGWGVLDSTGHPKAAYYYLKRAFQPVAAFFSDEKLNGLWLHLVNDRMEAVPAELRIGLYRSTGTLLAEYTHQIELPPAEQLEFSVDACFDGFRDLTYSYRFGPPGHDLVAVTLRSRSTDELIADAFYFPQGLPAQQEYTIVLEALAKEQADGTYTLTVRSKKFAQAVSIQTPGFLPDHNYFHIEPGGERTVTLRPSVRGSLRGFVQPLNACNPTRIIVQS